MKMFSFDVTWILFLVISVTPELSAISDHDNVICFGDEIEGASLRNVVFDTSGNMLYVGAVNTIYQLSPELQLLNSHMTGHGCESSPLEPCQLCEDPQNNCSQSSIKPVSSFSQLLVINSAANELMACSNSYNGSCEFVNLTNFVRTRRVNTSVVSTKINESAVGFVGVGANGKPVLYIGASSMSSNPDSGYIPLISTRDLQSMEAEGRVIEILPNLTRTFQIRVVAAFQRAKFVYFFVLRRVSATSEDNSTFVIRICKDLPTKSSMVEVPVTCNKAGLKFPLLRDAVVAPHSMDGAEVVFGVFGDGSGKSAVCVYAIDDIDRTFQMAIQDCFNGKPNVGPTYVTDDSRDCIKLVGVTIYHLVGVTVMLASSLLIVVCVI